MRYGGGEFGFFEGGGGRRRAEYVEERAKGVTERVASTLFISCVFDLFSGTDVLRKT